LLNQRMPEFWHDRDSDMVTIGIDGTLTEWISMDAQHTEPITQ